MVRISDQHAEIIRVCMDEEDPNGAMDMVLDLYDWNLENSRKIYNFVSRLRIMICSTDKYRNPEYEPALRHLYQHVGPGDQDMIRRVLLLPLIKQHRFQSAKKRIMSDRQVDKVFKSIRPLQPMFYEFTVPDEVYDRHQQIVEESKALNHLHQTKVKSAYTMTTSEIEDLIQKAKDCITKPMRPMSIDYFNNVAAICLLAGRRRSEIMKAMTWRPGPTPLQAVVGNLTKQTLAGDPDKEYVIPLLVDYTLFDSRMKELREFTTWEGYNDTTEMHSKVGQSISRAENRIFGKILGHTLYRNLYSEMAYRKREQNGFMIGDQACSKKAWIQFALAHETKVDETDVYMSMNIIDS